tara:strand:- start:24 stop:230 length:207 start_codon:yes stop_codon:yes gene_type:complete
MKVNELVTWNGHTALITELYESKVWRTAERGKSVSFKDIEPEPFARIYVKGTLHGVPLIDLKPIDEAR